MIQAIQEKEIRLDKDQILSRIGYDEDSIPSARVTSLVDEYLDYYHNLIESSYSYTLRNIESVEGKKVDLGDSIILESGVIARLLEKCEIAAVFAVTIGDILEDMVGYLGKNNLVLQATVLDGIGSCAAEQMAAYVENTVKNMVGSHELVISRRFSPGYCDWDVSQQEMVFKALSKEATYINLTDEYLMVPRKSVSGIIGIGHKSNGVEEYNPCTTCIKEECPGRRI